MPEDIDPQLCTHIVFAFGWLKKGRLSPFETNDETKDGKPGLYDRIQNLKKANPKLKTLLAIGKFSIDKYQQIKRYRATGNRFTVITAAITGLRLRNTRRVAC